MDGDRTAESSELLETFTSSDYFDVVAAPRNDEELRGLLDRGDVMGAVTVFPGFARALARGQSASVQVLVDGASSNTAAIVRGYAAQGVEATARRRAGEPRVVQSQPAEPELLHPRRHCQYPGARHAHAQEIRTMEQLMVTPIRPMELILASVLYLLTTLGLGVFISTLTRTQQQAMMSTFFLFMPLFMLSGFAFPISSMPIVVQYATLLNPVRHFMTCVRALSQASRAGFA
jgi:ABC-2 type transport system permease protein